jgi:hypothetical protein
MPNCPACHEEFARRKEGCCPLCGVELQAYKGVYFRADVGNPVEAIVKAFEVLVSQQTSKKQGIPVSFRFPRKSNAYRMELVYAQHLLSACEYDLDLVLESLNVAFTNKQFEFKTRTSLAHINKDLPLMSAIAYAIIQKRKEGEAQSSTAFAALSEREDIFA